MKHLTTALLLLTTIGMWSCKEEKVLLKALGRPGELLIVTDTLTWQGETGDALRECFSGTQVGLPQDEPHFSLSYAPAHNFDRVFHSFKNMFVLEINPKSKASIGKSEDIWAKGQLVVKLVAPDQYSAARLIEKNATTLQAYFNEIEIQRLQKANRAMASPNHQKVVKETFGVDMVIPSDYQMAVSEENFIWLRKESDINGHQLSQGLFIYRGYFDENDSLTTQMIGLRDAMTEKYVDLPVDSAFIKVYQTYWPVQKDLSLYRKGMMEWRGLWNTHGYFMGGPFVVYAFEQPEMEQKLMVDCYIFGPKFDKREYLRELEAIARSVQKN